MNKNRFTGFTGSEAMTIVDAMTKIDANAKGILFILDKDNKLSGCVTDGDIRRWLLKGGDLHAAIGCAMTTTPKFLYKRDRGNAAALMRQQSITALPILEEDRTIVDIRLLSDEEKEVEKSCNEKLRGVPVIIMAGGEGTRLHPFTKILPKPLIPIGETPIVERIINEFVYYGIDQYYITINYKKGMIQSYFSDTAHSYDIEYVEEDKPLGTGGSIKLIKEIFDKPLFVTNCDALIFADYFDLYDYHKASGNMITIVSALKNVTIPYGVLHSGENGELISMDEKPKLSYFVNTGMYVINPSVIELIPNDAVFHMTDLVEKVMKTGGKVGAYPISEDSFLDMGEFGEMKRMEEKLNIVSES